MTNDSLIEKMQMLKEFTGPYGIETPEQAINLCIKTVREHKPVMSKDALEKCRMAAGKALIPDGLWNIQEGFKLERVAKAVLDAAGVAYVE